MIWDACNGARQLTLISGTLFRLVESQEQIATMNYVDTLDEQRVLEQLLEQAKPDYPADIDAYHYLLTTPFRYPPLEYGSRFGRKNEPSLFYAGTEVSVALAEAAFYRFVFLDSIEGVTESDRLRSEHTLFNVDYKTGKGIRLQDSPFNKYHAALTSLTDYSQAQQLGSAMREAGVIGFEYESARDSNYGVCVALYNTSPFVKSKPNYTEKWLCEVTMKAVLFKAIDQNNVYHFPVSDFLINGNLPLPA